VTLVEQDDHMRPDTTMEILAKLPTVFKKDGVVTAGNASGIVDGAAALVIAGDGRVKARGAKPLGRIVSWATVGVEPTLMGMGPRRRSARRSSAPSCRSATRPDRRSTRPLRRSIWRARRSSASIATR
jgi:acetyl-CoA acetyltransferase